MTFHRVFVPMKPLALSKSRLRTALPPEQRELLSLAMLARVLEAATAAKGVDEVVVVGGDARVSALARSEGVAWRPEPGRDLNHTLALLFAEPPASPGGTVTYLPADLPLVTAEDVEALVIGDSAAGAITIAPDRSAQGTNGLTLPAAIVFIPVLGDQSFSKHCAEAERLGYGTHLCRRPGLGFDIDTEADLRDLLALEPLWWEKALSLAGAYSGAGT